MVDLAWKNLVHDRVRLVITVSGIAFAVVLVLVQVGLMLGLLNNASVTIEHIGADIWVTSRNTPNIDFSHPFPEHAVERVRSVPGVLRADNLIVAPLELTLPNGAQEGGLVYALEDFQRWGIPWQVEAGELRDLRRGNYVFMDASAERRYGAFSLGEYRLYQGQRFKIIGRTRGVRSFTTTPVSFMTFERLQRLLWSRLGGQTTYVIAALSPGADPAAVKAEISRRLPHNSVFLRDEWAARSRMYWIKNTGIGLNIVVTTFLGCLVGLAVVGQTLYTATVEHIREFGTFKAIGATNRAIYGVLLRQALFASLFGYLVGVSASFAIRAAVSGAGLEIRIPAVMIASVLGGAVLVCLLGATLCFRKVATIDPALVFRG